MRIEEKIRDYLADNLNFISTDLTLIKKEYHLPAVIGAKGFVDILAKDNFNNFVIIEVKRSEQAARQTFNELLKYQGLIKQIYKAQESEVKLIIVSTSWNELIVPFSEIHKSVYISGFKIELNSQDIPHSICVVDPIDPISINRKISPLQTVELFYTSKKRDEFIQTIKSKLSDFDIEDYVLINLNSNGSNPKIIYPFALYFTFQRQSMEDNYKILPNLDTEIYDIPFEDEDHKLNYIDELIYIKIDTYEHHDSMESSSPEKFTSILNCGDWDIELIIKNGIFSDDPRITDELIINEIKGLDGENKTKYLDFGYSKNIKKLEKIQKNIKKRLERDKKLYRYIKQILKQNISRNKEFKIIVEVFYPNSIFDAIWRAYLNNNQHYLPIYNIIIFMDDSDIIYHYHGNLAWTGKEIDVEKVLKKLTVDDAFYSFFLSQLGVFDKNILKLLGLKFVNKVQEISDGKIINSRQVKKVKEGFINDNKTYKEIELFYISNAKLMLEISSLYSKYTNQ